MGTDANRKKMNQKKTIRRSYLGTHFIAEFFGCKRIKNSKFVECALFKAAKAANVKVIDSKFHKFTPYGLTGYLLITESHISIHTWPEFNYAAVDVFTCGVHTMPEKAIAYLKKVFKASEVKIKKITRGKIKSLFQS